MTPEHPGLTQIKNLADPPSNGGDSVLPPKSVLRGQTFKKNPTIPDPAKKKPGMPKKGPFPPNKKIPGGSYPTSTKVVALLKVSF